MASSENRSASSLTRREMMGQTAGAAALLAGMAGTPPATAAETRPAGNRKRVLRVAHLTDMHVQPELRADEGMATCFHHVQSLPDRPDLILTGGDTVMDAFAADEARTREQWETWHRVVKHECSLPVESCIGNHDVWGWKRADSKATGREPLYGKQWAIEALRLPGRYHSFDRSGWHFVALDSTFPHGEDYRGRLDDEQFDWLAADLARTDPKTPVVVLSHIPILSAASFFDGENEKTGDWIVPGAWVHIDARRIKDLFLKHRNVRLCLSGHLHLVDRVDYLGVTYLCNGAVCGGWWKGNNQECEPGYAVVDLFADGTFQHEYIPFGWKPAT